MKIAIIAIMALLSALPTGAQATSSAAKSGTAARSPRISPSQPSTGPQANAAANDEERIRELTHRIQKLELEAIQNSGQQSGSTGTAIVTAIIGAVAVLCVAFIGVLAQYWTAKHQDQSAIAVAERATELARQEAIFRHSDKLLEFNLKRMEQFYAPMFAMLGQSEGLYNKMRHQLVQDEPDRYRWAPDSDPKDEKLQVLDKNGTWKDFRLLDQFPAVRKNGRALALADRILEIGKAITHTITQHAGLASEDLLDLLGRYLAHYAILSAVRQDERTEPYPPGSHEIGYYPHELNAKIAAGYREVAHLIAEYAKASKQLLGEVSTPERSQQSQ
jgi:hypothetical protein